MRAETERKDSDLRISRHPLSYGLAVLTLMFAACGHPQTGGKHWTFDPARVHVPSPTPANAFSVLDVGKPGIPRLSKTQLHWLMRIRRSKAYASEWQLLQFTTVRSSTPLTVFRPGATVAPVIGGLCNETFDADEGTIVFVPGDVSCTGKDRRPRSL